MGNKYIPDHKRTYEHLIGPISGMSESVWFPISPETQKDLIVALKIMGYVDHQYDKKDQLEQQAYAQKMVEKLQDPESVDMWEIDYVFTELANLLKNKDLSEKFIFYSQKILAHNAEACHTDTIDIFIKQKYLEGYTSAKIITLFLSNEWMDHQTDKLLCNLVAISNLLDDLLDINQDFEQWVSTITPSLKLNTISVERILAYNR